MKIFNKLSSRLGDFLPPELANQADDMADAVLDALTLDDLIDLLVERGGKITIEVTEGDDD